MKTQEFSYIYYAWGFSMSENLLIASDLLSADHVTKYGRHFEKKYITLEISST